MPLKNNILIHSTAGSGKTTCLVKVALNNANKKILITTYTRNNIQEIKNKFVELNGYVPNNVEIITWETFLLKNCIRPYQNLMGFEDRIYQVHFTNKDPHLKVSSNGKYYYTIKKSNDIQRYYLTSNGRIYSCKISEFADDCHKMVKGKMLQRIEECYDYIFVDEAQDFAGYDFEIMNLILKSKNIKSIIVADKRQNTFDTHYSKKNKKYAENIIEWFKFLENKKLAKLNYLNNTWRCNQHICDIADSLYPELPKSISKNKITTEHDGLFYVKNDNLKKYLNRYKPVVLAYCQNSCNDLEPNIKTMNFGISKGLTFDRHTLIQLAGYLAFLKLLLSEKKYPLIPFLIIDHISKPFDINNRKGIGEILNFAVEQIGVNNIQVIMFDDKDFEELALSPNKSENLVNDDKTGFIPFYIPHQKNSEDTK